MGLFSSKSKLISNIQFSNLLDPDSILTHQIVGSYDKGSGSVPLSTLGNAFAHFKGSLSKASMDNLGYLADVSVSSSKLTEADVLNILAGFGITNPINFEGFRIYASVRQFVDSYFSAAYGKDSDSDTYVVNGISYTIQGYSELGNGPSGPSLVRADDEFGESADYYGRAGYSVAVVATMTSDPSVYQILASSYGYDGSTVQFAITRSPIAGIRYVHFSTDTAGPDEENIPAGTYAVVYPLNTWQPPIYIPLQASSITVPIPMAATEDIVLKYNGKTKVISGDGVIAAARHVDVTPIIPVKLDKSFVDEKSLFSVLNKLGIGVEDFTESLSQSEIANAYIILGTTLGNVNSSTTINKVLYETFNYYMNGQTSGSGDFTISAYNMSMRYKYSYIIRDVLSPGTVGTYTQGLVANQILEEDSEGGFYPPSNILLTSQISPTVKRHIYLTSYVNTYQCGPGVNTFGYEGSFNGLWMLNTPLTPENNRLLIPYDVLDMLTYTEYLEFYEESLCFMINTQKIVKVKWYQQTWFRVFTMIVSVVLMIFFPPAGAVIGGIAFTGQQVAFLIMIASMSINILVSSGIIGGSVGAALQLAVAVASIYYGGPLQGVDLAKAVASISMSVINAITSHVNAVETSRMQEYLEDHKLESEGLTEELDSLAISNETIQIYEALFEEMGIPFPDDLPISSAMPSYNPYEMYDRSTFVDVDSVYGLADMAYS